MKVVLSALASAALIALAPAASASAALASASSATAPSAKSLELSRRLIVATGAADAMNGLISRLLPTLLQSIPDPNHTLNRSLLAQTFSEAAKAETPHYLDEVAPIYAQTFTEHELAEAVAFYESPVGRAMVQKTPQTLTAMRPIAIQFGQKVAVDALTRYCAKAACPEDLKAKLKS